jgi:hypothetical protein
MSVRLVGFVFAVALIVLLAPVSPALAQPVCDGVSQTANTSLKSVEVVTGLSGRPLFVTAAPGDTDRLFIVEQDGVIRVKQRGTAPGQHTVFLDISARIETFNNEQGLLGLAFHPDYASNGFFYVNYSRIGAGSTIVSRFSVDPGNPNLADATSESILLSFGQPEGNHNGGHLAFDSDKYLYISTGDGGGGGDVHGLCGNGQNTTNLLGKILRIDPLASFGGLPPDCTGGAYTIPADQPLADGPGGVCDEIWSYGLRNPWRFSFDSQNDDVYIGDVGQGCWEEVNYVSAATSGGENYGWRQMEGTHCFVSGGGCDPAGVSCGTSPPCNDPSLTLPVLDYSSTSLACSVTGGYVYRGCRMPNFTGRYFYGDYCDGSIRSFVIANGLPTSQLNYTSQVDPGGSLLFGLTSFGVDAQGELYVVDRSPGAVRKFLPPFPELEVSGVGVGAPEQFLLERDGNWSWEDLEFATMHPVDFYRVYRGTPGGTLSCIHSSGAAEWVAGDPSVPRPGGLFAYVVTAVEGAEESSSGGRTLADPCPAP